MIHTFISRAGPLVGAVLVRAVVVVGGAAVVGASGCTDLSVDGDVALSCSSNEECPAGYLCATALERCVDEQIVAETPIAADGEATVDAPRISRVEGFAVTVVTTPFSKAPTGVVTAVVDNRLALACEADDAGPEVQRCAFDARDFPDEADGSYDVVVVAVDAAGNEARGRARFEIDTTAPAIAPGSVAVTYESLSDLVRDVAAVGPDSRVVVQLSVDEVSAIPPTLDLVDDDGAVLAALARDEVRSAGPLQVFVLDASGFFGVDGGLPVPDGTHRLRLHTVDDVGNAADLDVDTGGADDGVVVDRAAPAAPIVDVAGRVVFERVPWGTRAAPAPAFTVRGGVDAAEPGGTVLVTSTASIDSSRLGEATVDGDGAFVVTLQNLDLPRVFVRVVDGAGNVGAPARVQDVVWTASLGGRLRNDDFSNPHALFNVTDFDDAGLVDNLRGEPRRAGDLVDGDGFVVDALPRRTEVRTVATGQPSRMAGTLGFLPAQKLAVIFGGVAARNGGQLTDTFVQRNERWTAIAGEAPPAVGPFAYDTVREELVSLLVNGDTWSFDGFAWNQLPVDPPTTTNNGPIAWDPIGERLIAVLGTETWVLGGEDGDVSPDGAQRAWQRLPGDAPLAGLRFFDGLNSARGAVIAFDAVDGHVILYGQDAAGAGAVFALIDDVWTRISAGPPVSSATAVEDATTGRVHFVCRSVGNLTAGAMLTWDGSAMVTGPAESEPRSACGATYDTAQQRILTHGGTNDGEANVQALPQRTVAVLDDGATAWREIVEPAPQTLAHNSGGSWHFDPLLGRTVLFGAFTGALTSRTVTLWDGAIATPTSPRTSSGPLFFDGINSRFVGFNSDQIVVGTTLVSVARALPLPSEALYAYDEDADAGFGFGGLDNGAFSDEAFLLRGSQFTPLPSTTRPPVRITAALQHDVANQRMILAGGHSELSAPLSDTWAYDDGDWQRLDDLPLGASGDDVQLLFDRGRGVMMGFIAGRLFDLRGRSWVERDVEILPRRDALAVYDEQAGTPLFVGGLDFERIVTTLFRYDIGGARAALLARFDIAAAGAADDAVVDDVAIAVTAGATGSTTENGVEVLAWGKNAFVPLANNPAPATAPASLTVTRTREELGPALRDALVIAVRSAPTGDGLVPARLVAEQLEVTVRYREP